MESNSSSSPSPTDSEESSSSQKRDKRKSKVWEKVVWFTRKSKNQREFIIDQTIIPDANGSLLPSGMDFESSQCIPPWTESGSSSDTECGDQLTGIRRSPSYPNSEINEQHCLKPSVARALFQRMEASNLYPKSSRPSWQKLRKRSKLPQHHGWTDDVSVDYTFSGLRREDLECSEISSISTKMKNSEYSDINYDESCKRCCSCQDSVNDELEDEECDSISPIRNVFHRHLCKKRPMAIASSGEYSSACKKRSSFSSLRDLYDLQNTNSLFSSLPSHYGSRVKSAHQQVLQRPHLCVRSELIKDSKIRVCMHDSHSPDDKNVKKNQLVSLQRESIPPAEFKEKLNKIKSWFTDFSDEQRNILLKDVLDICELPQIHLLSLEMEPRMHNGCPNNCEDLLTWLPATISLYILAFLDPVSLCQASAVCRVWNTLANEPCLWQRFCCQNKWRLSAAGEQKQLIQLMLPDGNIHWKIVFAERYRLYYNWLQGKCQVRTFEGHTQGISCVQFDDTRIVSGSTDKTIKVWNIRTNTPWSVQTLVGHSGTVRCLHLDGNRLVSGSTDRTIKVWDLSMQQSWASIACKVTMTGHTDTVRCLQVDDEKIISGSYDKTLKVWDMRTGECRMTLRGHDGAVLCVQFDSQKIISGSSDRTIKLWNFQGSCIMTLQGHQDGVTCLQFDQTRIVSGSLDCNLKFWDINTGFCVNTIDWKASEGHTGVVRCLQVDRWRVVSASDDKTIKVWNLETGERLVTLRNHTDGVTCLQYNDSLIVSGSYDKTVKLWDFSCC